MPCEAHVAAVELAPGRIAAPQEEAVMCDIVLWVILTYPYGSVVCALKWVVRGGASRVELTLKEAFENCCGGCVQIEKIVVLFFTH